MMMMFWVISSQWVVFMQEFVSLSLGRRTPDGGLGDVLGGFPSSLASHGHWVMIVSPIYDQYKDSWDTDILIEQKGSDILTKAVSKFLDENVQLIVLRVEKFDVSLAHMITVGVDSMLVPSRFEPWGLIQLHAMLYGTVPIVASIGGEGIQRVPRRWFLGDCEMYEGRASHQLEEAQM
eukprot:Gb_13539 [translate_table: standard]